jgi:hypothetical protein
MNKLWVGSIYYFLNVILHLGVFGITFVVSVPDDVTTLEYIADIWLSPEGKALIMLNASLLIANLVFALGIIFVAPRSRIVLIIMALLAWLGLVFAYHTETVGLVAYAAGAIHLSYFSFNQFRTKNDPVESKGQRVS